MSPVSDDLTTVKDDMVAFIEGHGMRRFHGSVNYEEVQCIAWEDDDDPDGWKKFVELAKHSGAPFLTMHSWTLDRDDLDGLMKRLSSACWSCRTISAEFQSTNPIRTTSGKRSWRPSLPLLM